MRFLRFVPAVVLLPLAGLSATPGQSYQVSDHGQSRRYTVAADESAAGRRVRKSATGAAATEEVVLYPAGEARIPENRRIATKRIAAQLAAGVDANAIAAHIGGRVVSGPRGADWYVFDLPGGPGAALDALPLLRREAGVLKAEPLLARMQDKRGTTVNDPLFGDEWHLQSLHGANVISAWNVASGNGVTLAIVDDGLQHSHPDLAPNYDAADSYDFNGRDSDPEPPSYFYDDHGTACAGVAAARGNNGIGVIGVAYRANLAGIRLISEPVTDEDEADAFAFHNDTIAIKSNSWGPPDRALPLEGPGPLAVAAIEEGVATGRGGKGTIYLFAGGNGATYGDNSNFDGYANRRETIAVGATIDDGTKASYSEEGANIVVTAPSSGGSLSISTTDRVGDDGYNFDGMFGEYSDLNYTKFFGGTSSASPLVAGVVALMLEHNPNLGWRDVQEILMKTAQKTDSGDPDWKTNLAGFHFNHKYGAGLVDAAAAVNAAGPWVNLGDNLKTEVVLDGLATPIPDNKPAGVEFTLHVESDHFRVEHVLLTTSIKHPHRGEVEVTLTSPEGIESKLAPLRPKDRGANYDWTFSSIHHWGEMAQGDWKVKIADRAKGKVGAVQSLKLTLWGAAPAGALQATGVTLHSSGTTINSIPLNGTLDVDFAVHNGGQQALTNVNATFAPNTTLTGAVTAGSFASIAPGETKNVRVTLTATGPLGTDAKPVLNLTANGGEYTDVLRYSLIIGTLGAVTVSGDAPIAIPSFSSRSGSGKAGPYPATANVSGLPNGSVVTDVKLHLHHVAHSRGYDIDALLVAPDSAKRMIAMSDVGGYDIHDADLTLTDSAENPLPDTAPLFGGTFRPANYGTTIDKFPAPAPLKPYQSSFSIFRGTIATGAWKLFIYDDSSGRVGSIESWELEIQYAAP